MRQHSNLAQRNIIVAMLLALAAAAWAVVVWHDHNSMGTANASDASALRVLVFIAMWAVMMVAMMFPSATPAILAFHEAQTGKLRLHHAFVSTCLFVTAYLLVWWGFAVYAGAMAAGVSLVSTAATATDVGGLILMCAGLYQLTPLKEFCLSHCRAPIEVVESSWRGWRSGAFYVGVVYGLSCLGCYWLLFLALFPLGMSITAMLAVSLVVLGEKMLPSPRIVTYAIAAVLVLYGAVMILAPQFLPPFDRDSSATAPAEMPMGMPRNSPMVQLQRGCRTDAVLMFGPAGVSLQSVTGGDLGRCWHQPWSPLCLCHKRSREAAFLVVHVRFWPIADIPSCTAHVCFWELSGHAFR